MHSKYQFKSVLAPYIQRLLDIKRTSGVIGTYNHWIFKELDDYAIQYGLQDPVITEELIQSWRATRINDCDRRIYFKFSAWIQLANLMKRSGIECYVPKLPKRPSSDFVPYIFTPTQIEDMLKKADEIRVRRFLLRLLYSTGLRISEALSILNEDVHIEQQYIRIRSSKNGCDRLVPICDSMKESLLQYIHYRNRMPIDGISDNKRLLFVKCDGTALSSKTISHYFVDVLTQCGIP